MNEQLARDLKCRCCFPMRPAVVRAQNLAHALELIRKARKVAVACEAAEFRRALFWTTKKEAQSELSRLPPGTIPKVSLHLGGSAFIG